MLVVGALMALRRIVVPPGEVGGAALGRAQRGLLLRAGVGVAIASVVFPAPATVTDQRPLLQGVLFAVAPALALALATGSTLLVFR